MSPPVALIYKGVTIRDRNEMLNLTDAWRACGSPPEKRPDDWKKDGAHRQFLAHVAMVLNAPVEGIWKGTRGRHGGSTMAHWHVGLAYAQWIDHDFHMWANEAVREKMEGRAVAAPDYQALARQIAAIVDDKLDRLRRELEPRAVAQAAATLVVEQHFSLAPGLTTGDVLNIAGVQKRKGLKGLAGFLSRRLERWHLQHGVMLRLGRLGPRTAKLFDPSATKAWLNAGGRREIDDWIKERVGQGKLFSIVPKKDEPQ